MAGLAHNLEVVGSNPTPATTHLPGGNANSRDGFATHDNRCPTQTFRATPKRCRQEHPTRLNSSSRWHRWEPHIHAPGTVLTRVDSYRDEDVPKTKAGLRTIPLGVSMPARSL